MFAGCATAGENIDTSQSPYQVVRRVVVKQLPGGIREMSPNGREFKSAYFPADPKKVYIDASAEKERAYALVVINGDSRPYSVNVQVDVESRQPDGSYVMDGLSESLTADLVQRIRSDLAHRREDFNIIDGFRAF